MSNLKFRVSAGLKSILGKDMITSPNIAVLELVKNAYDAHASLVEITITKDSLIIADNGKGMTENDLINKWLFVAYSAKSDGTEDKSYRSKFRRRYAGAKGIGRMSCDRLARKIKMSTRSKDSDTTEILEIDWSVFDNEVQKEFDTIDIPHKSSLQIPIFPNKSNTGTILEFTKLHSNWSKPDILSLKKSLEKMINPFSETDNFRIKIIAPLEIEEDNKKLEEIEKLRKNYQNLTEEEKRTLANLINSVVNGVIENSIADVLKLKTTKIESVLNEGKIYTKLIDRGTLMYEIEEDNKYGLLEEASISLFYLNRAAKYNFSLTMAVQPVNYGNVFLFRNGFRIWPYGEYGDDSWGLNQRAQQGYNRFLGTRDLFGRVDIETDNVNAFKEVSSRDGGLIDTPAKQQLIEYFDLTHRRLERYVVGVLWGEGFIRKDYFINNQTAQKLRDNLQKVEKDSDNAKHVFNNIGSKVDFLQLIKNLVNDSMVNVKYYNEDLANIVSNTSETEIIQTRLIDDLRKLAHNTKDNLLTSKIDEFEYQLEEMRRKKEEAERIAEEERSKAAKALAVAANETQKRKEEEAKRKLVEKERDAQVQKSKYLSSVRDTSKEVEDLMHTVLISSTELDSLVTIQSALLEDEIIDKKELAEITHAIKFNVERIHVLSSLITKADTSLLRESTEIDLFEYTKEFLFFFTRSVEIECISKSTTPLVKKIPILELSIVLQNLVSNARKANAKKIKVIFELEGRSVLIYFSDSGDGVDLEQYTKDSIFEVGVTNRVGGSGIGLSTIRDEMRRNLNGDIEFIGNNINNYKGATFRLTFR